MESDDVTAAADRVVSYVLYAKIVDLHVSTANSDHRSFRESFYRSVYERGISTVASQIELTKAFIIDLGDGKVEVFGRLCGKSLVKMPIKVEIASHLVRHIKHAALVLSADENSVNVRGYQFARAKLVLSKHQRADVENFLGQLPNVMLGVYFDPKLRIAKIFVPTVKARLLAIAVCAVAHARARINATAEDISTAEKHAVAI
jgi:hypothetical protein